MRFILNPCLKMSKIDPTDRLTHCSTDLRYSTFLNNSPWPIILEDSSLRNSGFRLLPPSYSSIFRDCSRLATPFRHTTASPANLNEVTVNRNARRNQFVTNRLRHGSTGCHRVAQPTHSHHRRADNALYRISYRAN